MPARLSPFELLLVREERSDSAAGWEGYATAVEERQRARFAEMTGGHPDDMPF